jgi:hypothetical protein
MFMAVVLFAAVCIRDVGASMCKAEIVCCGMGDRVRNMLQYVTSNHSRVYFDWRACADVNATANVFSTLYSVPLNQSSWWLTELPPEGLPTCPSAAPWESADKYDATDHPKLIAIQKAAYSLNRAIHPKLLAGINAYQTNCGWHSYNAVVGLHIRTGNPNPANPYTPKEMKHITGRPWGLFKTKIWTNYSAWHNHTILEFEGILPRIQRAVHQLGIPRNYAIFVATDTDVITRHIKETRRPNIFTRSIPRHETAHAMVYPHLRHNNAGKSCKLHWFQDPAVDAYLLGQTEVLFESLPSSFNILPKFVLRRRNKPTCQLRQEHTVCVNPSFTIL